LQLSDQSPARQQLTQNHLLHLTHLASRRKSTQRKEELKKKDKRKGTPAGAMRWPVVESTTSTTAHA
jgi:hypothetical protein